MTKQETVKIMAMLSAFYGMGKSDPKVMASAWHQVLREYDYRFAEAAVVKFAKADKRDYASFPTPGKLIEYIEKEKGRYNRLFNMMYNRVPYADLDSDLQLLIEEPKYNEWASRRPEDMLQERESFIEQVKQRDRFYIANEY